MAQVLLVHGSCHGAWCWRDLVPALAERGHDATAIDLPAHGADTTPPAEASLAGYAERIAAALAALPEPAILVGHSAGGAAVTAAAELAPRRIARLVYLCAYVLRDGESVAARRRAATRQPFVEAIRRSADGLTFTVDPAAAPAVLYHDCPPEAVAYAVPRLCPEPVAPQETPVRVSAASEAVLRHAILCTDDRTVPPEEQERMVAGWPAPAVSRIASGHSPFFSQPATLAAILDDIAKG
jgi:pimeloyl-ACP methyl ester carboxylesterase